MQQGVGVSIQNMLVPGGESPVMEWEEPEVESRRSEAKIAFATVFRRYKFKLTWNRRNSTNVESMQQENHSF